ncbi:MAG: porin [Thiotrichales bacterium]|nr:MAG: porin [Thiotrichales bacterium]
MLCLSFATALAEDTAVGAGTENTVVDQVENEKEEARKQVVSEGEDPQSRKTTERQQQAEGVVQPAAETEQAPVEEASIDQAREEVKSEEEEPQIDRKEVTEKPAVVQPYAGRVYGSIRLRYRSTAQGSIFGDAGSRLGLEGEYRTSEDSWAYARVEAGFNLLDELDTLLDPGGAAGEGQQGDSFFPRLYTVGIDTPLIVASYGKSWSTYYKISNFTDRFDSAGSSAVGTFNANTDGGSTGTGRADNVFQTLALIDFMREGSRINPFNLNIQFQSSQPIPGVESVNYRYAFGLSAVIDSRDDYTLGIAYNRAFIDDLDNAAVQAAGIQGDAEAILLGARWFDEKRYIGFSAARLLNHEATDLGTYFNGWGSELYARYRLIKGYWLVGGYNWLTPDEDEVQAGEYELLYAIVGLRYSIDEFNRLAYAEWRLDSTTTESGENLGNIFTIGIRWDF